MIDNSVSMDKSCIRSCAFALGSGKFRKLPTIAFHFMHRFISKRYGQNVAIGIIFGATRIIFKYSLTSIRFPDPAEASYMEKEGFPFRNVRTSEGGSRNWIYFRFQIDFKY
jgi:hypothetical protein